MEDGHLIVLIRLILIQLWGEHIQAFFNSFNINSGGDTVKAKIYESYYIVNKKIVWLDQYSQLIK